MGMARVTLRTQQQKQYIPVKKERSGAHVFGTPTARELESFISDAYPSFSQQRMLQMFFAGKVTPLTEDFEEVVEL